MPFKSSAGRFGLGVSASRPVFNSLTLTKSAQGAEVFVASYESGGGIQWVTRIGNNYGDKGSSIATDSSGNVYVVGSYYTYNSSSFPNTTIYNSDTTTFGTLPYNATYNYSVFLVKYDTNGNAQWAARLSSAGTDAEGFAVIADSSGNVYVSGYYSSTTLTIYNADNTSFGTLTNSGNIDTFIVKYNTSGTAQWATYITGSGGSQIGYSIATDTSENVYVIGLSSSSPISVYNANGLISSVSISNDGSNEAYIVKYNSSGTAQWGAHIGGTSAERGMGISTDSLGNVYVIGSYASAPVNVYNANGISFGTLSNLGGNGDVFIAKYNSNGSVQWMARMGGTSDDYGNDIAVDSSGNVYVIGYFTSSLFLIFNSNNTQFGTTLANSGSFDRNVFVVKYDTNGTVQWGTRIGGTSSDQGNSITTDTSGNIYVTGYFASSILTVYNNGGSTFGTLSNAATGNDAFIVKYDSSGTAQWAARIIGPGNDIANAISSDSSGNIYVTGTYYSGTLTLYSQGR